nr:MAG TPA: hypothetical protein [Crassvirales sp.]
MLCIELTKLKVVVKVVHLIISTPVWGLLMVKPDNQN